MSTSRAARDAGHTARYRLEAEIGRGATATVYRAFDSRLQRPVALKLFDRRADEALAELLAEARAAAASQHPNIVTVYDVGEQDGRPFIAMELVDGGDLADLLRARGRLAPADAARIGQGVAVGLGALHRRGLVHRDVKPRNVLLTADGVPKLADFGIALSAVQARRPDPSGPVGTAAYLAPEQVTGGPIDARADVYALGLVLFELLAGRPAYAGADLRALAERRLCSPPQSILEATPATPRQLAVVVERALSGDPAHRFPDGAAMAAALEPLARSGRTSVDPPTRRQAAVRGDDIAPDGAPPDQPTAVVSGPAPVGRRPRRPVRRIAWWRALQIAVPLLALLVAALTVGRLAPRGGPSTAVADVAGLRYDEAARRLEQAGLRAVRGEQTVALETPRGIVMTQQPAAGAQVQPGSEVRLVVSAGMAVPGEIGKPLEEARAQLEQYGWRVGPIRGVPGTGAAPETVVAQRPSPADGPIEDKAATSVELDVAAAESAAPPPAPAAPPATVPPATAPPPAPATEPAQRQAPERKPDRPPGRSQGRGGGRGD